MDIQWRDAGLAKFEDTLKCHVCKDFYNGPCITNCGHTFCSLCIRRHLDSMPRCPICWKETTIAQLKVNIAVSDATEAWTRARQYVAELESGSIACDVDRMDQDQPVTSKRKALPDNTGVCPICSAVLPLEELQSTHVDTCLRRQERVKEPAVPRKKITMPNYALLSEAKLKKTLLDAGLSTKGNKQRLQSRYREYVHLYNANLESFNPKAKRDLLQEMRNWDAAQDRQSTSSVKDIDATRWQSQYHGDFDELINKARESRPARNS